VIFFEKIIKYLKAFPFPFNKENWKVVFLCFFGAAIFWLFNALNKNYTTRINYPVHFDYNRDSLIAIASLPKDIPMNVTATGWQLLQRNLYIQTTPLPITPQQPNEKPFYTRNELLQMMENHVSDLLINYIARDTLHVNIDLKTSKKLPLAVDSLMLSEDYYFISDISIEPDSVMLTGPQSFLAILPEIFYVDLPDQIINNNFDQKIKLQNQLAGMYIQSNPEEIRIRFEVTQMTESEMEVEVELVNFPQELLSRIRRPVANLSFKIGTDMTDNLDAYSFSVIADFEYMTVSDSTVKLEIIRKPDFVKDVVLKNERLPLNYE
jgi:YbbR domain-containing protein